MLRARRSPALWVVSALCLSLAVPALAAEKKDAAKSKATTQDANAAADKAKADAMMAEMMKYAAPGPMHEMLKPLAGSWKTTTKAWMGGPEPVLSEGTCQRTWILGGRYLESKYSGNMMSMPFEGIEILGYDNRKSQFQSAWIDNMGTSITLSSKGTADPATKTITVTSNFDDPTTGKPVDYRMVTKIVDDNSHVFTMLSTRDGKEMPEMEITYTRVK